MIFESPWGYKYMNSIRSYKKSATDMFLAIFDMILYFFCGSLAG